VTEQELAGGAARRLAIIRRAKEVTDNVSMTAATSGSRARRTTHGCGDTRN
jgi:hypothetical protein